MAWVRLSKTGLNLGFVPRRQRCQGSAPHSCFRADATVRSPRRPDVAHLANDDKGTMPLLLQRFGGDAPVQFDDSACGETSDKCAFMMSFSRGLTFDLSGVPKARPLEGRVRRHCGSALLDDADGNLTTWVSSECLEAPRATEELSDARPALRA